jgi:hypothetical protein
MYPGKYHMHSPGDNHFLPPGVLIFVQLKPDQIVGKNQIYPPCGRVREISRWIRIIFLREYINHNNFILIKIIQQ